MPELGGAGEDETAPDPGRPWLQLNAREWYGWAWELVDAAGDLVVCF